MAEVKAEAETEAEATNDDDASTVFTSAVRGAGSVVSMVLAPTPPAAGGAGGSGGGGGGDDAAATTAAAAATPRQPPTKQTTAISYNGNRLGKAGARWVDTPGGLQEVLALRDIDHLAFDAEWALPSAADVAATASGNPLDAVTNIATVQLRGDASGTPAFVIDVTTLGGDVVFDTAAAGGGGARAKTKANTLRGLLEDTATVTKLMVDPRSDAALLWRLYGIRLARVVDVQLGFYPLSALVSGSPDPRLPGCTSIVEAVLRFDGADPGRTTRFMRVVEAKAKTMHASWDERPLPPVMRMYAALDVVYLRKAWKAIQRRINRLDLARAGLRPRHVLGWVCSKTDGRLDLGRSGAYVPSPASSRAPPFDLLVYDMSED